MNTRFSFTLLTLSSIILNLASLAQTDNDSIKNSFFIQPSIRSGPILDIYPATPDSKAAISGEVNLSWQTTGKQYWNQSYNFPQVGIILSLTSLGNDEILGQEFSLVPNLSYRFLSFGKFDLIGMVGLGFAYFNKPYNRIENPENKLIGSSITNKSIFALNLNYRINAHLHLEGGISYLHYSNGHNQLPNVGINIPAIQLGLKYFPSSFPDQFFASDSLFPYDKKWLWNVRIGMGIHEFGDPVKPDGGPKYPIYNFSIYTSKRLGLVTNFQAGIHVNYYSSFYDFITYHELYDQNQILKSTTVIGFAGMEFLIGNFSFSAQMGIYLYNPFYKEVQELSSNTEGFKNAAKGVLSYKFGAQYYLFDTKYTTRFNPWVGIFLKTNAGQADFAEFSIGCAF